MVNKKQIQNNLCFLLSFTKRTVGFFSMVFLPLIFLNLNTYAQKLATTQDGDIVILYNDGTWTYAPHYETVNTRNRQCDYAVNIYEPETGIRKTILKKDILVSYTNKLLKKENQLRDHVVCEVAVGDLNGEKVVYIDYTLQTPYAFKYYGLIQEGRKLLIKLKNDYTVELKFDNSDKGLIDHERKETRYRVYAGINDKQIEALMMSEADRMLMPWSQGNEIYPISNPELFINQLTCLE